MAMEFFLTAVLMFLLSLIFSVEQRGGGTSKPPRCYGQGEPDTADKPGNAPEGPTKGVGILLPPLHLNERKPSLCSGNIHMFSDALKGY